ncbi:MAG: triose-phosphate isomerase [Bryobacterales bacterium]|nr:triose-phosphate isomerase [Bryobacterales bacterium]
MRTPVIAGNWKMNKTASEAAAFVDEVGPLIAGVDDREVIVAPPFPALAAAAAAARGSSIRVSAQNLHWEASGAYTGEVSAGMLVEIGCTHVIVGHSERRQYFGETDGTVHLKTLAALHSGLTPIVCVGETLEQREAGNTEAVLEEQFTAGVGGLQARQFAELILAYEPVWAIGTGRTATPEIAEAAHLQIRALAAERFGGSTAEGVRILYGGSVNPSNFAGLLGCADIDGGLVGGASLQAESFAALVRV